MRCAGPWRRGLLCADIFDPAKSVALVCQAALEAIPEDLTQSSLSGFLLTLPVSGQIKQGRFFHLMELPGFGLLILWKGSKDFPALMPIRSALNRKLADSCLACMQNMKIESVNERLTTEISERRRAEAELKKRLKNSNSASRERTLNSKPPTRR